MILKLQRSEANPEEFYVEIQADGNHETLFTSEMYSTKRAAKEVCHSMIHAGLGALFVDATGAHPVPDPDNQEEGDIPSTVRADPNEPATYPADPDDLQ